MTIDVALPAPARTRILDRPIPDCIAMAAQADLRWARIIYCTIWLALWQPRLGTGSWGGDRGRGGGRGRSLPSRECAGARSEPTEESLFSLSNRPLPINTQTNDREFLPNWDRPCAVKFFVLRIQTRDQHCNPNQHPDAWAIDASR